MRKILFLSIVAIFAASSVSAQKSALKDAKRALGSNDFKEARTLINQATQNSETATNPETWKIKGDIEFKIFDTQRDNEILGKQSDQDAMFNGLLNLYLPYLKSDSLGELPDEKGKVRNRVRKDIAETLKNSHQFYINCGVYFNDQKDYGKAADAFEIYWKIPTLPMFAGTKEAFLIDSTYQVIKYYAIISAILAQEHPRAVNMLKRAANEPFIENSTYKEMEIYELLANEYIQLNDSVKYIETLHHGAEKFPGSRYFIPNLVNVFIQRGQNEQAMQYLDQAIANDPSNACDLNSVKGALLAERKDYEGAEAEYNKALAQNPDCERALEQMAVNYILRAQDIKEESSKISDRKLQIEKDKEAIEYYQKSLPFLEKFAILLKARSASKSEIDGALMKLRNVYYNLSLMGVDKSAQLNEVESELGL